MKPAAVTTTDTEDVEAGATNHTLTMLTRCGSVENTVNVAGRMLMESPSLYHFTCADHGHRALGNMGVTQPRWHPFIGVSLTWFTDEPQPSRDSVGLTAETFTICDRMAHRYRVTDDEAHMKVRRWLGSPEQANTNPHFQADLHRFSDPSHWWIATKPVLVTLDEVPDGVS